MTNSRLCHNIRVVKYFDWDKDKNETLKAERGVSFEEVLVSITEVGLIDIIIHPNKEKYSHQKIMIINIENYIYLVPFVEDEKKIFLKTIIPSRKATRDYLIKNKE